MNAPIVQPGAGSAAALLDAVLPFASLEDLLVRLARCWKAATGADRVVIGVPSPADETLLRARAALDAAILLPPEPIIPGRSLRNSIASGTPEAASSIFVPLEFAGADLGGVLICTSAAEANPPLPSQWDQWTARLVAQARDASARALQEKLAAMAEFAAGAGHEINNPLASILICAQRLHQLTADPEQQRLLATVGGQALRIRDMIGDVMLFARPPAPQPQTLDLSEAADDVLQRFEDPLAQSGVAVTGERPSPVPVHADPTQLRVVISELLRNAIEAQPEGGRVEVTCRAPTEAVPGRSLLQVIDAGPGLDEMSRRHLFDPFFSGRAAGRGLGFGLSKAWRIVTNHGGRIVASEPAERGLAVRVEWPASPG